MCGIFLHFTKDGIIRKELFKQLLCQYSSIEHRGPDRHTLSLFGNCLAGFHRLAINDLSSKGDQPFELNGDFLMCNGEIYNYEMLQKQEQFPLVSKSDCEIILHLVHKYGFGEALCRLDGVFAIVYVTRDSIYMARDRIGVKPLFYRRGREDILDTLTVASEAIGVDMGVGVGLDFEPIVEVLPSTYVEFNKKSQTISGCEYDTLPVSLLYKDEETALTLVRDTLIEAVHKRLCSDRPIGCLLSGGLDSSLIASILTRELKPSGRTLKTFSVGFPDSTDLVYARKVANYLGTDHHELVIQYTDALAYIPTVIKKLGSYDTTTVRASTPMYMLCEWINANFTEKVIFSGEGSDELFCGYLYSHNAPSDDDLFLDSIRLVKNLYRYDVLRADRCTAGNSLEFREPFLDSALVSIALQTSGVLKKPKIHEGLSFEKHLLRTAFEGYLPEDVLWRRKAAFSDAVSSSEKPWYKWIHEYVETQDVDDFGGTRESNYYKTVFMNAYKSYKPEIPLWLPKWSQVGSEPSATVLNVYNKKEHQNTV
jgi:asparagine synthase (glutamine-hydrolysing)